MNGPLAALYATELGLGTIFARMGIAAFLGMLLGIDREYLNRPAGLRTYTLVALAAATFAIITFELMATFAAEGEVVADPIRVIEAVTAGVAFLAAGTIIQARTQVHGLTTGAGLWLAGAIGVAAGVGAYSVAILATVFGVVVLLLLRLLIPGSSKGDINGDPKPDAEAKDDRR